MLELKYFVLRPSMKDRHGVASIAAIKAYADAIGNTQMAADLDQWINEIEHRQPEGQEDATSYTLT